MEEHNYEIGQKYYVVHPFNEEKTQVVEIVEIYPNCLIVKNSKGIRFGYNKKSAHFELADNINKLNRTGVMPDRTVVLKLRKQGYSVGQIADILGFSTRKVKTIFNQLYRQGLI